MRRAAQKRVEYTRGPTGLTSIAERACPMRNFIRHPVATRLGPPCRLWALRTLTRRTERRRKKKARWKIGESGEEEIRLGQGFLLFRNCLTCNSGSFVVRPASAPCVRPGHSPPRAARSALACHLPRTLFRLHFISDKAHIKSTGVFRQANQINARRIQG